MGRVGRPMTTALQNCVVRDFIDMHCMRSFSSIAC